MPLSQTEREKYRAQFNQAPVLVSQGELLEFTYVTSKVASRFPGRRSSIKGFTAAARLRMLRHLARIDWENCGPSLFVTLTYPDSRINGCVSERTMHRHRFFRDLENHLGRKVGALWRLEWQDRKSGNNLGTMVPHVHLIVFGLRFIAWQTIRKLWRGVLRVDGPLATDVRRITGGAKMARYVAKYAAKRSTVSSSLDIASYLNTGRAWGVHRRDLIPMHERNVNRLTNRKQIELLENGAAAVFPYFVRDVDQGFSLFGPIAKKVLDQLFNKPLDEALLSDYDA